MKRIAIIVLVSVMLFSCKDKSSGKKFNVKGKIENNTASLIYLEEIPMATMQRIVVDSVKIGKDGKYSLETDTKEATVYNLRLDENTYPIASIVNDATTITVDVKFNTANPQIPESWDVKGSPGSQHLKDFMLAFNGKLQAAFINDKAVDSLMQLNKPDSIILEWQAKRQQLSADAKAIVDSAVSQSTNPAVSMMILGYYQSTANNPGFKLQALDNDEVTRLVNDIAVKFPTHQGIALIKQMLDGQAKKATGWVGQTAPEITLPDVNGNEVKLSSFKGKYVLVDFWASWCKPCRTENPNLVQAYNKFKDKNFTVLGVSLDRPDGKQNWLQAIKDDNLTWTQVSDLQFWNSPVVPLYAIDGIPFNVLVDPSGKVVAQGLRGPDLDAKLAELLN